MFPALPGVVVTVRTRKDGILHEARANLTAGKIMEKRRHIVSQLSRQVFGVPRR
jgi:hypothetical protein